MSHWEAAGKTDEWYTPKYIFDALGCRFDLDVAASPGACHVPALYYERHDGLSAEWRGFVWMNPPFGGRNGIEPWLAKFVEHGNGVALTPDRTSAPWFQRWAPYAWAMLFLPKVKFERRDGSVGKSPSTGTALWAIGMDGYVAIRNARHLGVWMQPRFSPANAIDETLARGLPAGGGTGTARIGPRPGSAAAEPSEGA
ncbi:MAG: DNA N-6-adenine-methyltransferase [Pseudomonadota bacterium]